jgi:hypothetical protein
MRLAERLGSRGLDVPCALDVEEGETGHESGEGELYANV